MRRVRTAATISFVGSLFLVASPAAAFNTVTLNASGATYIGMRSDGYAVVETCNPRELRPQAATAITGGG